MKYMIQMVSLALMLAVLSCDSSRGNKITQDTLEASSTQLFFNGEASVQTVDVTTNFTGISIDVSEKWCDARLNSDNTQLTVSVGTFDGEERSATVRLTGDKGKSATIDVIQSTVSVFPVFSFGLIADIQYADKDDTGRYYRMSLQKLEECVEYFNDQDVQFTVNLGDLTDMDAPKNLGDVLTRLDKLNAPLYNTTGNHDYGKITDNAALFEQLGMPEKYYSFTRPGWRFIMLNTDEISEYANPTSEHLEEFALIRQEMKNTGRGYASYNGGISKKQMEWLEQELQKSVQEGVCTIVFSHHPLYGPTGLTALNDREILEVLSKYAPTVKAAIAGHHHSGHYGVYDGIPFITTEGMVESKVNAFAIVTVSPEKIDLKGFGRTKSYTIPLTK